MTGRPSSFNQATADAICLKLAEGISLRSICKADDMPAAATVFNWLNDPARSSFLEQYTRAREMQADYLFDETLDIADDSSNDWMERKDDEGAIGWKENGDAIRRSQLRIDTRKWIAGQLRPKKYGPATMLKHADADGEKIDMPAMLADRRRRAADGDES